MNEWKSWISSTSLFGNISDYFNEWSYGLRLSIASKSTENKFSTITYDKRNIDKAYIIEDSNGDKISLTPLVDIRKGIQNNTKISTNIVDDYDLGCMAIAMSENSEYNNLFTSGIPLDRLISLITIYNVDEFINFLSPSDKDLKKWKRKEETFKETKKSIINFVSETIKER